MKEAAAGAWVAGWTVILSSRELLVAGSAMHEKVRSGNAMDVGVVVGVTVLVGVLVLVPVAVAVLVAVGVGVGDGVVVTVGVVVAVLVKVGVAVSAGVAVAVMVGAGGAVPVVVAVAVPVVVAVGIGVTVLAGVVGAVLIKVGVVVGVRVVADPAPLLMIGRKTWARTVIKSSAVAALPCWERAVGENSNRYKLTMPITHKVNSCFIGNLSYENKIMLTKNLLSGAPVVSIA